MNETTKKTYIDSLINEVNARLQPFAKAVFTTVEKNNGVKLDALRFEVSSDLQISPIIYIEGFYDNLSVSDASDNVVRLYNDRCNPDFDLNEIVGRMRNQDWLLDHVQPRLSSHPAEDLISIPFLDLFITFAVEIIPNGWIQLKEDNCKIDKLVLLHHAKKNFPIQITPLYDLLWNMMPGYDIGDPNDLPIYVLSNTASQFGASAILDKDNLALLAHKLEDSLYILPSSIHECLAVPVSFGNPEALLSLVRSVNASDVISDEDFLSDSIYIFVKDRCHLSIV